MYIMDKQGAQWQIDEGLRDRAQLLQQNFDNWVGHVNLDQVIFIRLMGSKAKWHGKCFYIGKPPLSLISKYVVMHLSKFGLLNLEGVSDVDLDIFDIRFAIVINDDSISLAEGDLQRVEDSTLIHEMMHIDPDGEKLVKHDIEDFKVLVNEFGPFWAEGIFQDRAGEGEVLESNIKAMEEDLSDIFDSAAPPAFKPPAPPPFIPKSGSGSGFDVDSSD